jgi:sialidase-1
MTFRSTNLLALAMLALPMVQSLSETRIEAAEPQLVTVFTGGADGYAVYRIPSLIATPKGALLAFCEGRKVSGADESPTNLVLKRSRDGGKTWKPMQVIVEAVPACAGDPTPVVDRTTGAVLLVYELCPKLEMDKGFNMATDYYKRKPGLGRDSVTAWVTSSTDEGVTWSKPVDITAMTKKPEWTMIAHGPGVGIQTQSGRLVVPCWRTMPNTGACLNFFTYSDDHGKTWQLGDNELPGVNENQVVELADETLLLNVRAATIKGCRLGATSKDGGKSWSALFDVPELPDPCCQASILRYTWAGQNGGKSRILYSGPGTKQGRDKGTVRISYDEGKTWPVAKMICPDYFGYSCLAAMPNGKIGCLFETAGCSKINFAGFSLNWLTDGKDFWRPVKQPLKKK